MSFWERLFGKRDPRNHYEIVAETLAPVREKIESIRVPAIGLFPTVKSTFNRLGGLPLVPREFVWPRKGSPHSFLVQLDLSTLNDPALPEEGYLYFFWNFEGGSGYAPTDRGAWSVLYFRGDEADFSLAERPVDLDPVGHFRIAYLEAKPIWVFPSSESGAVAQLDLTSEQIDALGDLGRPAFGDHPWHQVLGVPYPIQGDDMEEQCQLVSNGVDVGSGNFRNHPRYEALMKGQRQWRLLLQLDSNDEFYFGDGMLYFWIKEDDLANRKFDEVWMVLQCT